MTQAVKIPTKLFFQQALENLVLDDQRTALLQTIAKSIIQLISEKRKINLNFICTHNSRRSQLAQVWSSYASSYFKLNKIESFSGGTEVSAFFRNTVKTLQEVGFIFQLIEFSHQNPYYSISSHQHVKPIIGFSKLVEHEINKKRYDDSELYCCSGIGGYCVIISPTNSTILASFFSTLL